MKQRSKRLMALFMSIVIAAAPVASNAAVLAESIETIEATEDMQEEVQAEEIVPEELEEEELFKETISEEDTCTDEIPEEKSSEAEVAEEEIIFDNEEEILYENALENEMSAELDTVMGAATASYGEAGKVYSIKAECVMLTSGEVSGMYRMDNLAVTVLPDGTYLVKMHQTSKNRDLLAVLAKELFDGKDVNTANTEAVAKATSHQVDWYQGGGQDDYWFTIPVASLDETLYYCMASEERLDDGKSFGNVVKCTFTSSSMTEINATPSTAKDMNVIPVPVAAQGITLSDKTAKTIYAGASVELSAVVTPENCTEKVKWSSDNEKIATVDSNGKVTGVADGTTTIRVSVGAYEDSCEVTVKGEFSYSFLPCLYANVNGLESAAQNARDIKAVLKDADGKSIPFTVKNNVYTAKGLDAKKTYTLTVSRSDSYLIKRTLGATITYDYAGTWDYTAEITRDNAEKQDTIIFKKDPLTIALTKIPKDESVYEETSLQTVKAAAKKAEAEKSSMDFARRDEVANELEAAISTLKVKTGVYAGSAEAGSSNAGLEAFDVVIIVEDGGMKAEFTCTQPAYKKLFLGTKKQAGKASDDDPRMLIGRELEETDTDGNHYYRFTMPFDTLNTAVSFSATGGSRWIEGKAFTFRAADLTRGMTINKEEIAMHSGDQETLTVKIAQSYSNAKQVTWSSTNPEVAGVADGVVTALTDGETVVTASAGAFTASCKIKVHTAKKEKIPAVAAKPGVSGLTEGWKCSTCGRILVEQKKTAALPIKVSRISVSASPSVKIAAGKKVQLSVNISPANAANKGVVWKSGNTKVATVNANGLVTMGKKAGGKSVVITATAKDGSKVYGSIKLTCMKGAVKKITISGSKTVKAGKSVKLKAKVSAGSKANKTLKWTSSNTKLATVSSKGVVKTFKGKKGTVTITAQSVDGTNKKKTFKIKIK